MLYEVITNLRDAPQARNGIKVISLPDIRWSYNFV